MYPAMISFRNNFQRGGQDGQDGWGDTKKDAQGLVCVATQPRSYTEEMSVGPQQPPVAVHPDALSSLPVAS